MKLFIIFLLLPFLSHSQCVTTIDTANALIVVSNHKYTGNINTINPQAIKKVTILDSSRGVSIYGSEGQHGVIIIDTFTKKQLRRKKKYNHL